MTNEEFKNALIQRHGKYIYEKLINSRVAIAGLGGLGSNVAIALARAGLGKLFLVDYDSVDITNLNRQQYFTEDIGRKKTDALSAVIKKINPLIKLETADTYVTEENALYLFKDYPIVCECFDRAENKAMLINALLGQSDNITVVSASGMAGFGRSNDITTAKAFKRLYICGDRVSGIEQGIGLMAPRVALCAMHQANTVLEIILKGEIQNG